MEVKTTHSDPVHYFSSGLVILLDLLWTPAEVGFTLTGLGIFALPFVISILAIVTFTGVFLVQKFLANDPTGKACAKAFVLAVLVAVPYPAAGTVTGAGLLGVSGVNVLRNRTNII